MSGRRVLRKLLAGLSRDWREAASTLGVQVFAIATLPLGATFAFDSEMGIVWATVTDDDCDWAAWAGIAGIVAARSDLQVDLSDLCAVAGHMLSASGLYLVSNSA